MNLGEVLALGPPCEVCQRPARHLYPLTRYNPEVGHFRPVRACASCCGRADYVPTMTRFPSRMRLDASYGG